MLVLNSNLVISPNAKKITALCYGAACHGIFMLAGLIMFGSIITGFSYSVGKMGGSWAVFFNFILLIQFPVGHSFFLTRNGMRILDYLSPKAHAKVLRTTIYATIASVQLLLLFILWSPSHVVIWKFEFPANIFFILLNLLSWMLLSVSSIQAGYQVQTGSLGWTSLYRNIEPVFPKMPDSGLFKLIRQPIYLSFCLVLWTSPFMTLDLFIVASVYTLYCFFGPYLKEKRFSNFYGLEFEKYKARVPYFFPKISRLIISDKASD